MEENKFKFRYVIILLIGLALCGYTNSVKYEQNTVFLALLSVGTAAVGILGTAWQIFCYIVIAKYNADNKRLQEEAQIEYEEKLKKQEKENKIMADGEWAFPYKELYNECLKGKITDLDSPYSIQKAITVSKSIVEEGNMPKEYWHIYCSEEAVKNYFYQGQREVLEEKERAYQKSITPQSGKITASQRNQLKLSKKLEVQTGIEKRILMLENASEEIEKQIDKLKAGQDAIKQVNMLLATSVAQEPKKDWAFLGGIADGIAGGAAGICTAVNAIAENEMIEARNKQRRDAVNQTIMEIQGSAYELTSNIADLKNELLILRDAASEAKKKVVITDIGTKELYKSLSIQLFAKNLRDNNGIEISGTITNNYEPDVPEDVQIAIDGTLKAEIYYKDILVDKVIIPLPVFGILSRGGSEKVSAFSNRFIEKKGTYTLKITPNNLWLVEV